METPPLFARPIPHLTLDITWKKKNPFCIPHFPQTNQKYKVQATKREEKKKTFHFFIKVKISN